MMMKSIVLALLLIASPASGIRRSETVEQQQADYLLEDEVSVWQRLLACHAPFRYPN